jgi:hypothetical protein
VDQAPLDSERPVQVGICRDCNYPLRDLPEPRCPECGRAFDPNDPATMNMGRPTGALARRLMARPGWPTITATLAPMLWLYWVVRSPQCYYMPFIVVIAGAFIVAMLCWFIYGMRERVRFAIARRFEQPLQPHRRGKWVLGIVFAMGVGVLVRLPLYIGFTVSRPFLERYRREFLQNPSAARPKIQWIGVYRIRTPQLPRYDQVLRFYIEDSVEDGFGYSEQPINYAGVNYGAGGHLQGPWYWFADD